MEVESNAARRRRGDRREQLARRVRAIVRGYERPFLHIAATLLFALLCASESRATSTTLAHADALWARRAEGQVDAKARPEPVRAAIAVYEGVLTADPQNLEAYWKLLRALWFSEDIATEYAARER
jgi:hypothetical protein